IGDLFPQVAERKDWERFLLSNEQVEFYRENGYLTGVRLLDDERVAALRKEVMELVDPTHPGNSLFYEFNSNESADPQKILFHALGAWRITPGLHDILCHPAFTVAA